MRLRGLGVSAGIGVGTAVVLRRSTGDLGFGISAARVPREIERLQAAREAARGQIRHIKERIAIRAGDEHAYLFDAQLLMLDDRMLVDRAVEIIRDSRVNAETALQRTLDEISALFDRADDPYLRERRGDVSDVVGRLCGNLRAGGDPIDQFRELEGPLVLVADELTPSIIAQLEWGRIAALVSDEGSWTYHTAILARSIRIPAVAGLRNASAVVPPGAVVAVDGDHSPFETVCWSADADEVGDRLVLDYFGLHSIDDGEETVFQLPYGEWIRLFRANHFAIEDLIEPVPKPNATSSYRSAEALAWARRWPAESIWRLRREQRVS